jgi:surface antigen
VGDPEALPGDVLMPLSSGSCTAWAEHERPDIWYHQAADDPLGMDWDAWTWTEHAEAEGLAVSGTPQAGDIAVWQPGAGDTGPDGHVAYVEGVEGGQVTLSEMNAPFDPVTLTTPEGYPYYERTVAESELSEQAVAFISPAA